MIQYEEALNVTKDLFLSKVNELELNEKVQLGIIVNNNAKSLYKVVKSNTILKYKCGDDVIVVLNESETHKKLEWPFD